MKKTTLALAGLARAVMRTPLLLRVVEHEDGRKVVLTSTKPDMPRLIGSEGATAYALERIAKDIGIELVIAEPEELQPFECLELVPRAVHDTLKDLHAAVEDNVTYGTTNGRLQISHSQMPPSFFAAVSTIMRKAGRNLHEDLEVLYA